MIESLVEQMKSKLDERDKTIQDLQKHIEENVKLSKLEDLPKKSRKKVFINASLRGSIASVLLPHCTFF